MKSFEDCIEKVANHIAEKATKDTTPFAETVDALKAMTAYYALLVKRKPGVDPDEGDDSNFENFTHKLKNVEQPNGGSELSNRQRRTRRDA